MDLDDPWADPPQRSASPASTAIDHDPWASKPAASPAVDDPYTNAWAPAASTFTPAASPPPPPPPAPITTTASIDSGLPTWGDSTIDTPDLHHHYSTNTSDTAPEQQDEDNVEAQETGIASTPPAPQEAQAPPPAPAAPSTGLKSVFSNLFSSSKNKSADSAAHNTAEAPEQQQTRRPADSLPPSHIQRRTDIGPVSLSAYVLGTQPEDEQEQSIAPSSSAAFTPPKQAEEEKEDRVSKTAQAAVTAASNAAASASAAAAAAPSAVSRLWGRFSSNTASSNNTTSAASAPAKTKTEERAKTESDWAAGLDALAGSVQGASLSTSSESKKGGAVKPGGRGGGQEDDDVWDIFGQPSGSSSAAAPAPAPAPAPASSLAGPAGTTKAKPSTSGLAGFLNFRGGAHFNRPRPGEGTGIFDDDDDEDDVPSAELERARREQSVAYPTRTAPTSLISSTARAGVVRSGTVRSDRSASGAAAGGGGGEDMSAGLDAAFTKSPPIDGREAQTATVGSGLGKGRYATSRAPPLDVHVSRPRAINGRGVEAYDVDAVERESYYRRGADGRATPGGVELGSEEQESALEGYGEGALGGVYRDYDAGRFTDIGSSTRQHPQTRYDDDGGNGGSGRRSMQADDDAVRYGYAPGQRDAHSPSLASSTATMGPVTPRLAPAVGSSRTSLDSGGGRATPPTILPPPPPSSGASRMAAQTIASSSLGRSDSTSSSSAGTGRRAGGPLLPPPPPSSSSLSNAGAAAATSHAQTPPHQPRTGDLLTSALNPTSMAAAPLSNPSSAGLGLLGRTATPPLKPSSVVKAAPAQGGGAGGGASKLSAGTGLTADDLSFFEKL
ncbi:hypothetical protein V8E36_005476 [Tilletia maclaganii]